MRKFAAIVLPLALLPFLAGCVNDAASFQIEGKDNALTLIREQRWFWKPEVDLSVTASRLPDCQRRHQMGIAPIEASVEVWQTGPGTFLLKRGKLVYLAETQTCEGFQKVDVDQLPGGMGNKLGVFQVQGGKLSFVPAPPPPAPAPAPAPVDGVPAQPAAGAAAPTPIPAQ